MTTFNPDFSFAPDKLARLPFEDEIKSLSRPRNHLQVSLVMVEALKGKVIFTLEDVLVYREHKKIWQKVKTKDILATVMMTYHFIGKDCFQRINGEIDSLEKRRVQIQGEATRIKDLLKEAIENFVKVLYSENKERIKHERKNIKTLEETLDEKVSSLEKEIKEIQKRISDLNKSQYRIRRTVEMCGNVIYIKRIIMAGREMLMMQDSSIDK